MKDRLIAAAIHLAISLMVAGLILFLLFVVWFPSPLMELGAFQGVQLILLVDLAIGPLLTLIVFKKGKKTLVLDMSVIAALQLSALSYGMSLVYSQTPSYLVLTYQGIFIVNRYEVENYVSEKQLFIPEEVLNNTTLYEGQIPIYKLTEASTEEDRMSSRMDFENEVMLPFYMNAAQYQVFAGYEYLISAGRGSVEDLDNNRQCLNVPIVSVHGSILTCLYEDEGELRLSHTNDPPSE